MTPPFCVCSAFLLLATEAGFIGMCFGAGTDRKLGLTDTFQLTLLGTELGRKNAEGEGQESVMIQ